MIALRRHKVSWLIGAAGLCVAAILVSIVVRADAGKADGTDAQPVNLPSASAAEVQGLDVLRDATSVSSLPPLMRAGIEELAGGAAVKELSAGTSRLPGGKTALVAGNNQILCLANAVEGEAGIACSTTVEAKSGNLAIIETCAPGLPDGRFRIVGVAPSGVEQVAFRATKSGDTYSTATVDGNVYEALVPPVATEIVAASAEPASVHAELALDKMGPQGEEVCGA